MANVTLRISAANQPTVDTTINGVANHRINASEAQQALRQVAAYRTAHGNLAENLLTIIVDGQTANTRQLRRIAGTASSSSTPDASPTPTPTPVAPEATPVPTPAPTPNATPVRVVHNPDALLQSNAPPRPTPRPTSSNGVSTHGLNVNTDFFSTTAPGFRSGTILGGSVVAAWNPYLTNGRHGSLSLILGGGARGIFGDGNTLASAGGPTARLGINAEVRLGSSPFSLFGELAGDAFAVFGRHQLPGRADWTSISQNLGIGARGQLGLRAYVSHSTSLDFAWAPQMQYIPDAVTGINGVSQSLTYTSPLAFALGVTHHPSRPVNVIAGQELCAPYEMTPNGARTLIADIRSIITELRVQNNASRATLAARFPNLNVSEILPAISVDATENRDVAADNQCPSLTDLIQNLFSRALDLAEQNGELARLQPLPEGTSPHYIRALIQIHHLSFLTARPYTTTTTGSRLDNVPANVRSMLRPNSAPITVEEIRTRVEAAITAAPNHILLPADRRTQFAGIFSPELVGTEQRFVSCDTLDNVGEALNSESFRGYHVLLVGHTDHGGPADYNQRLSVRRAEVTGLYLRSGGVAGDRIATYGVGESESVYTHDLPANRQRPTAEDRSNMMNRPEINMLHHMGIRDRDLTALLAGRAVSNRALDIFLYRPEEVADANNHSGDNDYVRGVLARINPGTNTPAPAPVSGSHATVLTGADASVPSDAAADAPPVAQ